MFDVVIDYLSEEREADVVRATTTIEDIHPSAPSPAPTSRRSSACAAGAVSDAVLQYALLRMVRMSRPRAQGAPEFVTKWVDYGGSVRAAQYLILGGKARALTRGRYHVSLRGRPGPGAPGPAPSHPHQLPRIGAGIVRRRDR